MTPLTIQRTALEEDCGPDTRTIVDRVTLDVKNQRLRHIRTTRFPYAQPLPAAGLRSCH